MGWRVPGRGRAACAGLLVVGSLLAGCARPHETEDERIRRQAAEEARQVRHDAEQAGTEARKAARQAGREARDIVAGVREGWQEGAPAAASKDDKVDLNTASEAELASLPGLDAATAHRIAARRPYRATGDLLRRAIVSRAEYARIEDRVRVQPAGGEGTRE